MPNDEADRMNMLAKLLGDDADFSTMFEISVRRLEIPDGERLRPRVRGSKEARRK